MRGPPRPFLSSLQTSPVLQVPVAVQCSCPTGHPSYSVVRLLEGCIPAVAMDTSHDLTGSNPQRYVCPYCVSLPLRYHMPTGCLVSRLHTHGPLYFCVVLLLITKMLLHLHSTYNILCLLVLMHWISYSSIRALIATYKFVLTECVKFSNFRSLNTSSTADIQCGSYSRAPY